jgi:hypothetical protein
MFNAFANPWEADFERQLKDFRETMEPYEREKREQERLRTEQEAVAAKREVELFGLKSTVLYSEAIALEICERISSGELLINICDDEHMPTVRRCTQWLRENSDFSLLYKESINDRLTIFEEEVIKIADDARNDFKEVTRGGRTVRVHDGEAIARAKLRVEVRFRHLKAGRPAKWGEQSTLITKDETNNSIDDMSLDELEKKIASLEMKDRIVKAA